MRQARKTERAEPRFEPEEPSAPDALHLRLSDDDRPVTVGRPRKPSRGKSDRREPRFGEPDADLVADPDPRPIAPRGERFADQPQAGRRRAAEDEPRRARADDDRDHDDAPPPRRRAHGDGGGPPRGRGGPRGGGGGGRRHGLVSWALRKLVYWGLVAGVWGGVAFAGIVAWYAAHLPPTSEWSVPRRPPNVQIVSAEGTVLGNRGETGGEAVRFEQMPGYLPKALMAIEDRRFKQHFGIDPIGLARAVFVNLTSGSVSQGGSTLTQQLAKNLFLTPDRTMGRKIQEVVLALWLEHTFTKDQILELYLNRVYFGAGTYGVDAAARRYFDKSARQLSLLEAATLAGLLKAPSRLSPSRDPDAALQRASVVLAAMVEEGYISAADRKAALADPHLVVHRTNTASENYVADWVMDQVPNHLSSIDTDIVVETTIDPQLQILGEAVIQGGLLENADKKDVSQGALVSLDPTGAVKALVGGVDYSKSQYNRATTAKRQPGSSFKPFVYLTALENGLTPDSLRIDQPISIKGWKPQNYSKEFRGQVTLRDALALSLNTVAVQLAMETGPSRVVRTAHRLGVASKLEPNASIALGTSEVTMLEIASAYVPFSNGGYLAPPRVINRITTAKGKVLYQAPQPKQPLVIQPQHLAMMNDMLQETLITGTAAKARIPGWMAGGKTGTSQEFRDAWFIGYTGRLTTAVWFGNDDGSPTNKATGGSMAAGVWQRYMIDAHRNQPVVAIPGGKVLPDALSVATIRAPGATPAPPAMVAPPANGRSANDNPRKPSEMDGLIKRLFGGGG
ncbi:MAG: penicillin-binding protein [Hyphomicrobiaceae bacterium]|nr:penicillin-binding protein [Hyphomicrobiaceae bacterium]